MQWLSTAERKSEASLTLTGFGEPKVEADNKVANESFWAQLRRKFELHFSGWRVDIYDSEDLVQEAWEKAYRKRHTYKPGKQSQMSYLFEVGVNRVRDIYRKHNSKDPFEPTIIREWVRVRRFLIQNLSQPSSLDAPINSDEGDNLEEDNMTFYDVIPAKTNNVVEELIRKERIRMLKRRIAKLTAREKQVARCLMMGLNQAATARTLNVSVRTVRTYKERIGKKLGGDDDLVA